MCCILCSSPGGAVVKNLPAMQETQENGLRKISWRRKWHPTPVFLPGESRGQRSLGRATVHGVTKSWTRLSKQHTHATHCATLEKLYNFPVTQFLNYKWR